MTLEQAHDLLNQEYLNSKTIEIGTKKYEVPDNVRVAVSLIKVTEIAKEESSYFSFRKREVI